MSYNDPWAVLGLMRDGATEGDVKAAYAEKLKVTRPDDDPAGFMALRAAFENARAQLRWAAEDAEYDGVEDYNDDEAVYSANARDSDIEPAQQTDPPTALRLVSEVLEGLKSPWVGSSKLGINALLDRTEADSVDVFQSFSDEMLYTVYQATTTDDGSVGIPDWLNLTVLQSLDDHFGWSRQSTAHNWSMRNMITHLEKVRRVLRDRELAPRHIRRRAHKAGYEPPPLPISDTRRAAKAGKSDEKRSISCSGVILLILGFMGLINLLNLIATGQ
ncbi:MAG: hypothetical protein AAFX08_11680 [Pseudomonadota bacterium]